MSGSDWRPWAFTLFAGAAGWLVGAQGWPVLMLLALPLGDMIGTRVERRRSAPATRALQEDNARLRTQLSNANAVVANALLRTNQATAGLVTAADLAVRLEEDVRALIVADLHDSVAQTLVAASYLAMDPNTSHERLGSLATEAEDQLREIMNARRPLNPAIDSFAGSLSVLFSDLEVRHSLEVSVRWPQEEVMIPRATAVVLYRFVAEALTNVVKHAKTREAEVALVLRDDQVVVEVADHGAGFETADLASTHRLGLVLANRRAEMVGGSIEAISSPGGGTLMRCTVPMAPTAAA